MEERGRREGGRREGGEREERGREGGGKEEEKVVKEKEQDKDSCEVGKLNYVYMDNTIPA